MRARPSALLLLTAVAALAIVPAASAQKMNSRGGPNFNSVRPTPMPPRGGGDHGGYHGGYRGGFGVFVPGIVVGPGVFVDDGAVYNGPPRTRRQVQQSSPQRASNVPPANERRYVVDEVVIELPNSATTQQVDALRRRHGLTPVESQRFELSGTTLYRWRIPDRRSVPTVVSALEGNGVVAQPNYLFALQETSGAPATEGDAAQYELSKLHLPQAHALAKGDNVLVAVIDSGVDVNSPELAGSIADTFDTLPAPFAAHKHGTAIAGLIAAHGKLMGAAPNAKILAIRAFNPDNTGAQGTTFDILKGLDWAAAHHARVINMSFAGPPDPALHRALEAAHKKGIVLIAAAGNAGAKSPPLYPAADANVIAVTATDADDKLFEQSNRGNYIAVAAPGAQIMVALPDGGYELSSGTSYSAAEVSGIAALMLQRDGRLTPDKVRRILETTAKDLGAKGRDPLFGFGLADAYAAVMAEPPPVASATPAIERVSTGAR